MSVVLIVIVVPIIVGVGGGVIVKYDTQIVRWLAERPRRMRSWPDRRRARKSRRRQKQLVREVVERSKLIRKGVPTSIRYGLPTLVTYSTGGTRVFYDGDLNAYKRDGEAGRFNPATGEGSPYAPPATTVHQWSIEELEKWLADHRDDQPA